MLTQLYRLLMILHHGLVIETSKLLSLLLRGHSKSLLDWTTDVRLRE